jgi:Cys-rich repeat protein
VVGCYYGTVISSDPLCQAVVETGQVYLFDQTVSGGVAGPAGTTFRACTDAERRSTQRDCDVSSSTTCGMAPPYPVCRTSQDCPAGMYCDTGSCYCGLNFEPCGVPLFCCHPMGDYTLCGM